MNEHPEMHMENITPNETPSIHSEMLSRFEAERELSKISIEEDDDDDYEYFDKKIEPEQPCFLIEYGGKALLLSSTKIESDINGINKKGLLVDTFLINTKKVKQEKATTLVFEEAFKILQDWSNKNNIESILHIETYSKKIALWLINNPLTSKNLKTKGSCLIGDMRETTQNMHKVDIDTLLKDPTILKDNNFLLNINIIFYHQKK
jgi:hypothetical protein